MRKLFFRQIYQRILKISYFIFATAGISVLIMCTSGVQSIKYGGKLYVSTTGNDNWSGKIRHPNKDNTDGPFATIERARDEIGILKETGKFPKGNMIVEVQEGLYELEGILELGENDGGSDSLSRVIYMAEKDADVRLSGGKKLSNWTLVSDKDVLGQLNPAARDKIYQTDLSTAGINDFGSPAGGGAELFFNDKPMWISRYPNKGFVKITGILNEDPVDVRGTKGDKTGKFIYDDPQISLWKNEKDAWVHGYWFWDWSEQRHKIAKIVTEKKIIEVDTPYHNYGYRTGQWFYGFNLLSEIDEPGEYYIDRTKGILYFYPPSDIEKGVAFISLRKNIIDMNNVSFLTVKGFVIEGSRETAVRMKECKNSLIVACTIRNVGDWAVTINGGIGNGVAGCDIYDACYESNDAGAIYTGRNWTMRGNMIRYNYLHDISGFEGKGCVGIYLDDAFSSAEITGNVFCKVTRAMMIGGGRDNYVINNIFIDCVPSIHVDARGIGWMQYFTDSWIKEAEEKGTISGTAYDQPPYSTKYPKLVNILNDEPRAPKGNIISRNICVGGVWDKASGFWSMSIEDKARPFLTMEDNIVAPNSAVEDSLSKSFVIANPLFVNQDNPEQRQFQLNPDSPALKHGFTQIPFNEIGLYKADNRASWPVLKN